MQRVFGAQSRKVHTIRPRWPPQPLSQPYSTFYGKKELGRNIRDRWHSRFTGRHVECFIWNLELLSQDTINKLIAGICEKIIQCKKDILSKSRYKWFSYLKICLHYGSLFYVECAYISRLLVTMTVSRKRNQWKSLQFSPGNNGLNPLRSFPVHCH